MTQNQASWMQEACIYPGPLYRTAESEVDKRRDCFLTFYIFLQVWWGWLWKPMVHIRVLPCVCCCSATGSLCMQWILRESRTNRWTNRGWIQLLLVSVVCKWLVVLFPLQNLFGFHWPSEMLSAFVSLFHQWSLTWKLRWGKSPADSESWGAHNPDGLRQASLNLGFLNAWIKGNLK